MRNPVRMATHWGKEREQVCRVHLTRPLSDIVGFVHNLHAVATCE